jgi:hypothetical protein
MLMRKLVCAVTMVVMFAGVALAEEYQGKLVKIDPDTKTITININEKDIILDYTADTKFYSVIKGEAKELKFKGTKGLPKSGMVMVKTEKRDGKEIVTEARITPGKKK